ncbi:hypothetical protein J8J27_31065, partial [Mycobacterium tuberculosis]|nr:hypothetical protein [Mycobacterium tuberculosis]
ALLLTAAGVATAPAEPPKTKGAKVTWDPLRELAETKKTDLNADDVDAAAAVRPGRRQCRGGHGDDVPGPADDDADLRRHVGLQQA